MFSHSAQMPPPRRDRDRTEISEIHADADASRRPKYAAVSTVETFERSYEKLVYGYFRDRPYDYNLNLHVVQPCEWGEGVQFPQWLEDFKTDYGPV